MGEFLTWEEKWKKVQALNLTRDVFAGKALEESEVLEEFLNLLTGRHWHICEVKSQYSIRQVSGHSVVLDLYAKEADGARIHLELQNKNNDEHILRTRYCRACIDITLLDTGQKYRELSELWQMCEIFDKVRQDGIEYGRQEGLIISIEKMINALGITKERACEIIGLELSEYENALSSQPFVRLKAL